MRGTASRGHGATAGAPDKPLRRRIVVAVLLAALLPVAVTGLGSCIVFERIIVSRALDTHAAVVTGHATAIELYLAERLRAVELVAESHDLDELSDRSRLDEIFSQLNETYDGAFVDLGVIESTGRHLSYVGPYDLGGRDYSQAEWFHDVSAEGTYVSDVFLGYRGVPHCVMAVRRRQGDRWWVLRATLDSERLDALVRTVLLGETGDVFLVNGDGVYQTTPRIGRVLDQAPTPSVEPHLGVRHRSIDPPGEPRRLLATAWIERPHWALVVVQDEAEVLEPVRRTVLPGVLVAALAFLVVIVTTIVATEILMRRVAEAKRQRDEMSRDLLRSSKLASLGELATGLAHEINNPLGIISAEKTNIGDVVGESIPPGSGAEEILDSVARIGRQVDRCAAVTSKMLRFGRHDEPLRQSVEVAPLLTELVALLERQARVRNVELELVVEGHPPPVRIDPTELEQVVVNLVQNSMQAIEGHGRITVSAAAAEGELLVAVEDDGAGIHPDDLDRVFQPFFTTKDVGQGTGLGLSVCYGIVTSWGGRIDAESTLNKGTRITLRLPVEVTSTGGASSKGDGP